MKTLITTILVVLLAALSADANDPQPPRAARSVHLIYPAPASTVFYNEMTVRQSQPGSYFMACGFSNGYFGIQELRGGNKIVLFSVWDPGNPMDLTAAASRVPADLRVEVLAKGSDVFAQRFGGEGTGAKSMLPYSWKTNEVYRFMVQAKVEDKKTTYSGYFFLNETKQWKLMATFRTLTGGVALDDIYSFVEDFRRDGQSPKETRRALFGSGWAKGLDGQWRELTRAMFSADRTRLNNINATIEGENFTLATGGETTNTTRLGTSLQRPASPSKPVALELKLTADIPAK